MDPKERERLRRYLEMQGMQMPEGEPDPKERERRRQHWIKMQEEIRKKQSNSEK